MKAPISAKDVASVTDEEKRKQEELKKSASLTDFGQFAFLVRNIMELANKTYWQTKH